MKTKLYLSIVSFVIFQTVIFSQTHTWTGAGGGNNWFNVDNWDAGSVPSAESNVFIPSGFLVEISESEASVISIEIEGISTLNLVNDLNLSGQLTIPPGSNINWTKGILNGGGTVENNGLIQLSSFEDKKLINSTIENFGAIYINNSNIIRFSGGTVINNYENALIEILTAAGFIQDDEGNTINNYGTIRKSGDGSGSLGSSYMIFDLNNFGTIHIGETQQFLFLGSDITLNNMETGVMEGFGAFDVTSDFINLGTYAPGNDLIPGTLSVYNNFGLSPQTKLVFDFAGTNPDEYDVIDVAGFPDLEGNIVVNLAFGPELGDQFHIITANEIQSCDFPPTISAQFEGYDYTFEITCSDTKVTLKVVDIILGIDDIKSGTYSFYVHPNPVKENANIVFKVADGISIPTKNLTLQVYNSVGLVVKTLESISAGNSSFRRDNLSSGLYVLQLKSENKVIATTKLIVE